MQFNKNQNNQSSHTDNKGLNRSSFLTTPLLFKAILARSSADMIKSKILSPNVFEIVIDCYGTPDQFANILNMYFEDEFQVELKPKNDNK